MTVTYVTPVDVSPTADDTWRDVDVSAYIPTNATGVMLKLYDTQVSGSPSHYNVGVRKNGSTDTLFGRQVGYSHQWGFIGVDTSRIFECRRQNSAIQIWLWGYTQAEAVYFTNGVDSEPASNNTWTDKDISSDTGTNTAIGAIVWAGQGTALSGTFGMRCNGSTDNIPDSTGIVCAVRKVDGSEIFETYVSSTTNFSVLCVGYFKAGATFNTNGTDVSLGTTGSYTDLTALGTGAVGSAYFVYRQTGAAYGTRWNIRKNGASDDTYVNASWEISSAFPECDSSQLCEGKIETTGVDFYDHGYFTVYVERRVCALI